MTQTEIAQKEARALACIRRGLYQDESSAVRFAKDVTDLVTVARQAVERERECEAELATLKAELREREIEADALRERLADREAEKPRNLRPLAAQA